MLGLLKKSTNGNGLDGYHRFTPEELTQVKMLDLRQIMKDKGVKLSWANNQYESQCPFHEDKMRSPRLQMNQKDGVWLWKCDGGHHGGTIIDFIEEAHGVPFPRAVEYLRQLICPMPKLNGEGSTIGEILEPLKQLEVRGSTPSHPTGQELEAKTQQKGKAKTEEVFTSSLQPRASSPSQSLQHHTSSPSQNPLFLNARGERLGREGLAKIVNKAAKRAGLDKPVTPHVFRRSCATGMIRNKANPYYVKELLGHEHLDSLEPYLKLSIVDLKEVHKKCHPRERGEANQ